MIDSVRFGHIVIHGREYASDVIIYPDRVETDWWRKEGHTLYPEDIEEVFVRKPEVLIVGTGASGLMRVSSAVEDGLKAAGITLRAERTGKACALFNELSGHQNVVAALHLTS
ncbi:MAG: hypothetical protein J7M27_14010 [Candidatus Latescibacteria bacterium]|nr:hypothetical protein [Candidatus Latescibacterota bacterium]